MSVKNAVKAKMEQHIQQMIATNPMIGQLNTQFTSWLLGSGLTGKEIIEMIDTNMDATIQPVELSSALERTTGTHPPGWVINGLMSVLDMDKDGNVTVADLHTYFEAIGLPSGIEETPLPEATPEPEVDEFEELDKEIEEEARRQAEELIRQKKLNDNVCSRNSKQSKRLNEKQLNRRSERKRLQKQNHNQFFSKRMERWLVMHDSLRFLRNET